MRKFVWIVLLFLGSCVFVFAAQSECEKQKVFFVESVTPGKIGLSNIFCNSGKTQNFDVHSGTLPKNAKITAFDTTTHEVSTPSKTQKFLFGKELQTRLLELKKSVSSRQEFLITIVKEPENFDSIVFELLKQFVFTLGEQKVIEHAKALSHIDKNLYESTYSQRLLMNGEIISREEWGADENISKKSVYAPECVEKKCVYNGNLTSLWQNYVNNFQPIDLAWRKEVAYDDGRDAHRYYPVDRIIIHHTASKYVSNKEEGIKYMQSLQRYHGKTLQRSDIGYHYLIDGEGNIYEGRAGWKYVLGAHVTSHNFGSIGISLMSDGYYSPEMLASLQRLTSYLAWEYGLDITTQQNVRNADLTGVILWDVVIAHKELEAKKPLDPNIDMEVFRDGLRDYALGEKKIVE